MRQLDSCDFCGNTPEGVFEVVPASVAGDARRLALCADCRETLESVTEPLLAAAESAGTADSSPSGTSDATETTDSPTRDGSADATGDQRTGATAADTAGDQHADAASGESTASEDDAVTIGDAESSHQQRDHGDADEQPERKPPGYAQVVRLLQNRDGAMPRGDLRALATNAYDLGEREVEEAVTAAVDNGDLQETSDGLQTE
ncbi:hypothetical protein [Halobacterium zhouii]|uniref:hypothetical protein n=1 Tax=Halobacterium zhouii TaxID=2902624 RepID=UPI001E44097B|nr:hypothetical protein [Halobacterium zhouii]